MNNIYLKNKENIKSIIIKYLIAITPLLLYGEYKNGIKPYLNRLVGIKGLVKPLVFDITGILLGIIANIIYIKIIKKEKNVGSLFANFNIIYGLLIASVISINTNYIIFVIVSLILLIINNFFNRIKPNIVALTSLILIILTKFISNLGYLNIYERTHELSLNSLDYLIGRGQGGINTTCIILIIVSCIVLNSILSYKKDIVIYLISTFTIATIIYLIITNNIGSTFTTILSNGILFSYIFVATEPTSSSYTKKGKIVYSTLIAMITILIYPIYPEISAVSAILIVSIFNKLIDKLCEK